ncbi:DJ-1/PfpI family protein-like protein [Lindgomyces ingoldianus]|uniref:DJ-1/PfpI family protein-like protein n=1 Tax=Lindgomyces ingoldianus TaxID=673940 RepID=A0ACB6QR77_9PLEO|nr:DJ-1/PfpI family protein-like protein [Lindgomyces ingoldianus]KAF2469367.1 DJ-1/PfpI family protein-like protein [Lindgomyces ingoldianus]
MPHPNPPKHIGVILFPGFQLLDVAGPLDVLNILSKTYPLRLSILAQTLDPVSTAHNVEPTIPGSDFAESIVPTHTFANPPKDLDVAIIPGGFGTRDEEVMGSVVGFVKGLGGLRWIITVCTGSAVLARTGLLDGKRATSNKKAFAWVKQQSPAVHWVSKARWVVDGNIWTSSGISAGIDLIYAWVGSVWGEEVASLIADSSEYERNTDSGRDRFAERWGVAKL